MASKKKMHQLFRRANAEKILSSQAIFGNEKLRNRIKSHRI